MPHEFLKDHRRHDSSPSVTECPPDVVRGRVDSLAIPLIDFDACGHADGHNPVRNRIDASRDCSGTLGIENISDPLGFDFLGYRFDADGLIGVAKQAIENFVERASRLYERGVSIERIGEYVRRWLIWVRSGVSEIWPGLDTAIARFVPEFIWSAVYD